MIKKKLGRKILICGAFLSGIVSAETLTWTGGENGEWNGELWKKAGGETIAWVPGSSAFFPCGGIMTLADEVVLSGLSVSKDASALSIEGGALAFNPMSSVVVSNQSTVIHSPLSSADSLSFVFPPNKKTSDVYLTQKNQTLFQNVSLDQIRAVDGTLNGSVSGGSTVARGFHLRRENNRMTVQLQVHEAIYTKSVIICLEQQRDDIVGRSLKSIFIQDQPLGIDMESPSLASEIRTKKVLEQPSGTDANGYGVSGLSLSLANASHVIVNAPVQVDGNLKISSGKLVLADGKNLRSENFVLDQGELVLSGTNSFEIYENISGSGNLSVQTEEEGEYWVMGNPDCVKKDWTLLIPNCSIDQLVGMRAKATGNHFPEQDISGYNLQKEGDKVTVQMQGKDGNFVKAIGIEIEQRGKDLFFKGAWAHYKQWGSLGEDASNWKEFPSGIAEEAGKPGYGAHLFKLCFKGGANVSFNQRAEPFVTERGICVARNQQIEDVDTLSAKMLGGNIDRPRKDVTITNYVREATSISAQVQTKDGSFLKCVFLEVFQEGNDLYARVSKACWVQNQNIGYDFSKKTSKPYFIATSENQYGYGVVGLELKMTNGQIEKAPSTSNSFTGTFSVKRGHLVVNEGNALPSSDSCVEITGTNSILTLDTPRGVSAGGMSPIDVKDGALLILQGQFNLGYSANCRPVTLDGGILYCPLVSSDKKDSDSYMNQLVLKNHARIVGSDIRLGDEADAYIHVGGTDPSTIETGMVLVKRENQLYLDIEDVTSDSAWDLDIQGCIRNFEQLPDLPVVKRLSGTIRLSGANSWTGPLKIEEGTVQLAGTHGIPGPIEIAGGSLALEKDAGDSGTLNLQKDGNLLIAEEGSITFKDSSEIDWNPEATLNITGKLGKTDIRFGKSQDALSAGQLNQIRYEGHRVELTPDGYLVPSAGGTIVILL